MINLKKTLRYSLYALLPLFFFALVQMLFMYGAMEINPAKWSEDIRLIATMCGLITSILGGVVAHVIVD